MILTYYNLCNSEENAMSEGNAYQRLKILYLYKILFEQTDEYHALSMPQIIEQLEENGFSAARKALYEDIDALRAFGVDIASGRGNRAGYAIVNRDFEIPELMLLADAVVCSPFFTEKKAKALIEKLEGLCSIHEAAQIERKVYTAGRESSDNERIYLNVDAIHRAIAEKKKITFKYFDYNIRKQKVYRDGLRTCSPYALAWNEEKYYLIAHYEKYGGISHFRVDKMECVEITDEPCLKKPRDFKLSEYLKSTFSMFSGNNRDVWLLFENKLTNAVIDRFGKSVKMQRYDDEHFTVRVSVKADNPETFFGWLFQFGTMAKILEPVDLRERYSKMLKAVIKSQK